MKLYEVRNGYAGESYVRCYVVAETEDKAIVLARVKYKEKATSACFVCSPIFDESFYNNLEAEELLDVSIEGTTELSD